MLEDQIRRLTAAVEILTAKLDTFVIHVENVDYAEEDGYQAGLREGFKLGRAAPVEKETKKPRAEKAAPAPEKIAEEIAEPAEKIADPAAPPPADPAPSISKENLKAMALSISRADTSAKPLIFEILGKYGAKTITALPDDPAALHDVFTSFTKIANKIAKDGE
jgi:uncharacterized membrane protein